MQNRLFKETKPLIVLDTNVLVSGLCRFESSPSYKILSNIQKGKIPLVITPKLLLEYESVLYRSKILKLIGTSKQEIYLILDALLAIAQESEPYYLWRPNLRDESDNFVLEAAISTSAILVTKNIKDFKSGDLEFPDLLLLTPEQFCRQYLKE